MSREKGDYVNHLEVLTPQQAMNEVEKVRVSLTTIIYGGQVPQFDRHLVELAQSLEDAIQAINGAFGVLPDSWKAEEVI